MSVNWKRVSLIAFDVIIGTYLVLAITAFNKPDEVATVCSEVIINEGDAVGFLNRDEVRKLLVKNHVYPLAQPMKAIDTRQMEEVLCRSPYIEQAECYKTQGGHICIDLVQRSPLVHVMAQNGDNYYMDTEGNVLPSAHYTNNVLVATGAIDRNYARRHLRPVAALIAADKFWQNQVVQLNVLRDGSVELVPRVGEHIAYLGQPTDVDRKLSRLRKFYKYGLSAAGWNKYSYINVEFSNQIVCKKVKK